MSEQSQQKKIIVDEDWKEEAQREKEMLARAFEERQRRAQELRLPEASLEVLATSIAVQAMIALGAVADPKGTAPPIDLDAARFHIDLLEVLRDKTRGNLTARESKMLEQTIFDLQMSYVECSRQPAGNRPPEAKG